MDKEDLSLIRLVYYVLDNFELELPSLNARANDPPPDRLEVYEEVLETRLRFSLSPFVLELLHFYGISLCILTLNFVQHIVGF